MPRRGAGGANGGSEYRRIVKVGDPARIIADTADRLGVDAVVMGRDGLGRRDGREAAPAPGDGGRPPGEMGSVARSVLALTSRPVAFLG